MSILARKATSAEHGGGPNSDDGAYRVAYQQNISLKSEELKDISMTQRMISASSGSLITSFVVTPFDVIRIRMQQQEMLPQNSVCCQAGEVAKGMTNDKPSTLAKAATSKLTTAIEPEVFWLNKNFCKRAENCTKITSTLQGFSTVSKNEGISTLWRGLSLNLLMAIPSNIIYFTGYEHIRDHSPFAGHPMNPLFCGSLARILAATFISPMELIKTRLQSIPSSVGKKSLLSSLVKDLVSTTSIRGVGTLFTGLQITLWRDAPFSGVYWLFYETFKKKLSYELQADFASVQNSASHEWLVFSTSFISGSVAGSIAAFVTHPFDVGKTRLQITNNQNGHNDSLQSRKRGSSMFSFLGEIYRKEGIRSLYSGFGPRLLKVAPSCAIMISSYEIGKKLFKNGNNA